MTRTFESACVTFRVLIYDPLSAARIHPAIPLAFLSLNLAYEALLIYLLFTTDLHQARGMMTALDASLGVPLQEKSYAEDCDINTSNIRVSLSLAEKQIQH
jgi:phosphatidylserine synthase 2